MRDVHSKKTKVIREYRGNFSIEELVKNLIHIHLKNNTMKNKGCSDHEVQNDEK